jgi:hypothetical protein
MLFPLFFFVEDGIQLNWANHLFVCTGVINTLCSEIHSSNFCLRRLIGKNENLVVSRTNVNTLSMSLEVFWCDWVFFRNHSTFPHLVSNLKEISSSNKSRTFSTSSCPFVRCLAQNACFTHPAGHLFSLNFLQRKLFCCLTHYEDSTTTHAGSIQFREN